MPTHIAGNKTIFFISIEGRFIHRENHLFHHITCFSANIKNSCQYHDLSKIFLYIFFPCLDKRRVCCKMTNSLPLGLCGAGYYCTLGAWQAQPATLGNDTGSGCDCPAQSTGGQCLAGTFCPTGSHQPTPCTRQSLVLASFFYHLYNSTFETRKLK